MTVSSEFLRNALLTACRILPPAREVMALGGIMLSSRQLKYVAAVSPVLIAVLQRLLLRKHRPGGSAPPA